MFIRIFQKIEYDEKKKKKKNTEHHIEHVKRELGDVPITVACLIFILYFRPCLSRYDVFFSCSCTRRLSPVFQTSNNTLSPPVFHTALVYRQFTPRQERSYTAQCSNGLKPNRSRDHRAQSDTSTRSKIQRTIYESNFIYPRECAASLFLPRPRIFEVCSRR